MKLNNLVKYSRRLVSTIQTFKLPEAEADLQNSKTNTIDVPELESALLDQEMNETLPSKKIANAQ